MHDDFAILAAIAAHPSNAFGVLAHLQALGLPARRSTLYRRVDALIAQGLVTIGEEPGESGRPKRALQLTDAGRKLAASDAREVLRREPLESPLFALALGCTGLTDADGLPALLRPRLMNAARRLNEEERALAAEDASIAYWTKLARQRRIAHLQADLVWLQAAVGVPQAQQQRPALRRALRG